MKTRDLARNRWHGILPEFGIDAQHLRNIHGPCPLCGGKDRFRFDNKDGNGTWFCNQCGSGDSFALLKAFTGQSFSDLAKRIDEICGKVEPVQDVQHDPRKARRRLKRIGKELQIVKSGDPVSRYLRGRGIVDVPSEFLRFHPGLTYWEQTEKIGTFPAMVAAFRDPAGRLETFHVTYLTSDGQKAPVPSQKKVMGKQQGLAGCAIRLSEVAPHIGICEGIETALSVTALYGVPCWACYSANALSEFVPPAGVEQVTIYADADCSYTGQAAATAAAARLFRQKYRVEVHPFLPYGVDYNDLLIERTTNAA